MAEQLSKLDRECIIANRRSWTAAYGRDTADAYEATCQALEQEVEGLRDTYANLAKGCPTCQEDKLKGEVTRILIDEDGCSVGAKPKRWGHGYDDYHWYCDEAGAIAENDKLKAALEEIVEAAAHTEHRAIDRLAAVVSIAHAALNPHQEPE